MRRSVVGLPDISGAMASAPATPSRGSGVCGSCKGVRSPASHWRGRRQLLATGLPFPSPQAPTKASQRVEFRQLNHIDGAEPIPALMVPHLGDRLAPNSPHIRHIPGTAYRAQQHRRRTTCTVWGAWCSGSWQEALVSPLAISLPDSLAHSSVFPPFLVLPTNVDASVSPSKILAENK